MEEETAELVGIWFVMGILAAVAVAVVLLGGPVWQYYSEALATLAAAGQ